MRIRFALVPLLAAALVAGCTEAPVTPTETPLADFPAAEILAKAKAAVSEAKSYQVVGTATDEDGVKADLEMTVNGEDRRMVVKTDIAAIAGTGEGEVTIELIKVGADLYAKFPSDMFKLIAGDVPEEVLALFADKWLKLPEDEDASSIFGGDDPFAEANLFESLTATEVEKAEELETINGVEVVKLTTSNDEVIYVATSGKPYPVRVTSGESTADFSQWDSAPAVTAPPAGEVFDLSAFAGMVGE